MKKKVFGRFLVLALTAGLLVGCGSKATKEEKKEEAPKSEVKVTSEVKEEKKEETGEKEVLKFYHAYFHDEATWPVAVTMRSIYEDFANEHKDGPVTFEAVPVEDVMQIATNEIAGGSFPNMVDFAGNEVPLAAISQNLVLDLKPYIDAEGLQNKVGINYDMNMKDGQLFTVHDQLLTIGMWYNADAYKAAGASTPDSWKNYEDMSAAMEAIRKSGKDGAYAYSAGQGSIRLFNAYMGLLKEEYAKTALTPEIIQSEEFKTVFKTVAAMDQANGSANSSDNVGNFSGDFNSGKCNTFLNGVWASGGFGDVTFEVRPAVYPGNVSLTAPGGGLTIASSLSEGQKALALEFLKYMTSDEVQKRIFLEVNANPCNKDIDVMELAKDSDKANVKLLAEACSLANNADKVVNTINYVWGSDVQSAIINKLIECSVEGTDIDAKLKELQAELVALIG